MEQYDEVRVVGQRVEHLLDELRAGGEPRAAAVAEELVGALVQLYGTGLRRLVGIVAEDEAGPRLITALTGDPLVESLLLVHDLHPLDTDTRVQQALDRVRPYLGSHAGGVEYLGVDAGGVVHLRLEGSCNGCASSTETVRLAIAQAIEESAPETTGVDVEGVVQPQPLLQIGRRGGNGEAPPAQRPGAAATAQRPGAAATAQRPGAAATAQRPGAAPDGRPGAGPGAGWVRLTESPPEAGVAVASVAGTPVVLCRLGETLYAYRDVCPACRSALRGGHLDPNRGSLRCPGCGGQYDVRLAGAGLDGSYGRLVPLPLLVDDAGVRVAMSTGGLVGAGADP